MTLTTKVLLALGAGLGAGVAVSASGSDTLQQAVGWIEPVGTIWVNALRMTIVPLVVAGLVVGAASSSDARAIGRLGGRAFVLFLLMLIAAATFTVIVAPPLFDRLPLDPAAVASLRASAGGAATAADAAATGFPDFRRFFIELVPANAFRAAADGAILPLIVFSLALGFAAARIGESLRLPFVAVFRGLFDAMLELIRWILELAPIGVFALALPLATRLGIAAAGAVIYFIVIVCGLCVIAIAALYPLAAALGRVSPRRFARAVAPPQSIALSARSSLASLPVMIENGRDHLGFPPVITNFFLPLSASTFRFGSGIGIACGVLFVARLYGIDLNAIQLATIALTTVLVTFSVPGVPGGSILIMAPVLQSVGVPPEGIGILLGVDTIPDMFRTAANVTGTMAAATILAPAERSATESAAAPVGVPAPATTSARATDSIGNG
jgi:Na+/H+-dicarboxylate symporter